MLSVLGAHAGWGPHLYQWPAPLSARMQHGDHSVTKGPCVTAIHRGVCMQHIIGLMVVSFPQERVAAEGFMAGVRQAYPEVAVSVRTTQLAHRLLARKAAFVGELGRSGALSRSIVFKPFVQQPRV